MAKGLTSGSVRLLREFRINDFSLVSSTIGDTECIKSRWDFDGYEWEIHCYPRWYGNSFVEFRLMFLSEAPMCAVKADLSCLLVHPETSSYQMCVSRDAEMRVSHVFKCHKDWSAGVLLVKRSLLRPPTCPMDDYLAVQCSITVMKEQMDTETMVPVPASNLHKHLGDLLKSEKGADVTFLVSGESFLAHKNILAARSPVLMAEFFGHMRETSAQRIVIEDMEASAFKAMLHFIYTDTMPELDKELEAAATMAQHLLVAADRYGLDRLRVICVLSLPFDA